LGAFSDPNMAGIRHEMDEWTLFFHLSPGSVSDQFPSCIDEPLVLVDPGVDLRWTHLRWGCRGNREIMCLSNGCPFDCREINSS